MTLGYVLIVVVLVALAGAFGWVSRGKQQKSTGGPGTGDPSTGGPSTGGPSTGGPSTGGPSTGRPSTGGPSATGPGIRALATTINPVVNQINPVVNQEAALESNQAAPDELATISPEPKKAAAPAPMDPLPAATSSSTSGLAVDRGRLGNFNIYAASQIGRQHSDKSDPREDSYALGGVSGWPGAIVVVADGLGSARRSDIASQVAAKVAVEEFRRAVAARFATHWSPQQWESVAAECFAVVAERISSAEVDRIAADDSFRAGRQAPDRKSNTEPGCTLSVALVESHEGAASLTVYWACVGDSRIATVTPPGQLAWISANSFDAHHEMPATSAVVTNFVDSVPRDTKKMQCGIVTPPADTMVVLATDGVTRAFELDPDHFGHALVEIARTTPAGYEFGGLLSYEIRQLYDDRTMVMAWSAVTEGLR